MAKVLLGVSQHGAIGTTLICTDCQAVLCIGLYVYQLETQTFLLDFLSLLITNVPT